MSWLALAIVTRFFWACSNLLDQYVARYFRSDGLFSIVIAENLTTALSLPVLLVLARHGLSLTTDSLLWIIVGVGLSMAALFPYMRAMQIDEAHNVVPLFELTPVFVMLLAGVTLGESMTLRQSIGALLVILSGFAFTWDFNHGHLKRATLALMGLSSLFYAICQLTMRHVTRTEDPFCIAFYFTAGALIGGLVMAALRRNCRESVIRAVRESRGKILAVTALNEFFARAAMLTLLGAYAQAPAAGQVAAFSGVQPVFVFGLALLLSFVKPLHYKKLAWDRDMKMKLFLLPVMVAGGLLVRL